MSQEVNLWLSENALLDVNNKTVVLQPSKNLSLVLSVFLHVGRCNASIYIVTYSKSPKILLKRLASVAKSELHFSELEQSK